MNAIFAYNKMDYHYKPMNDDFLRLAKLSVKSAKKYYNTKFYGDKESYEYFKQNDINFDTVVILNNEDIFKYYNIYSISKIYGMMRETEPYVLIDFDVVLFERLESNHTITYGQPELIIEEDVALKELTWAYESYIKPFDENLKDFYVKELEHFRWKVYPSFCVMMVNNPLFVSSSYKDILNRIPQDVVHKLTPTLLEQLLLHQYVNYFKVDYGFFVEYNYYNIDTDFHPIKMTSKKFVHLNINDENIKLELKYLEGII